MAEQKDHVGMNKTGVQMSPLQTKAMLSDDKIITRGQPGDETAMAQLREAYIAETEGLGSIPVPGNMKGMASMAVNMVTGNKPQILLDKMAERLAMERTATRLYDALLVKVDALHGGGGVPVGTITREQVASIRGDEARHALLMRDAIASMGGDPTAMTPSADLVGVEAMGLVQVLSDPRTNMAQSLHAILTAELSDGVGWETLIALAHEHGQADLVDGFSDALLQERKHQALIQTWYEEAVGLDAGASAHASSISTGESSRANVAAADPGTPGSPGNPTGGSGT
ncbi:ferritin-like domain-containing protein [Massilia sp. BSC265]|uniref:ferritin-like domain-containing protein n=1 Tax=Massilia sp. BSC265 TaxID=1549812 RepID=UPI000AD8C829|nr:ferritin-like domain-containing protein [Massilia sp. BSC265]